MLQKSPVTLEFGILNVMDHLSVLKEKIVGLRAEIAQIQELNEQYRREKGRDMVSQIAHTERHERLEQIKQELGRLAELGREMNSVSRIRERNRPRGLHLVNKSRVA
jgi:hypothetical protein